MFFTYFRQYPFTLCSLTLYLMLWLQLLLVFFDENSAFNPITIGEFPLAPVTTLPFCILMLINAAFRAGQRWLYLALAILIFLPFIVLIYKS